METPAPPPSACGIAWYRRDTYARCVAIFEDGRDLPATFDEWLVIAKQAERDCFERGIKALRIEIDPNKFPAWCADHGFTKIDSQARADFENFKSLEWVNRAG